MRFVDPKRDVPALLAQLRIVRPVQAEIDKLQDEWVHDLLACGVGFTEIAAALGVSRQVVHRRYANRVHAATANPDGSVTWTAMGSRTSPPDGAVNDR